MRTLSQHDDHFQAHVFFHPQFYPPEHEGDVRDFLHHDANILPELIHCYGLTHHGRQTVLQYAQVMRYLQPAVTKTELWSSVFKREPVIRRAVQVFIQTSWLNSESSFRSPLILVEFHIFWGPCIAWYADVVSTSSSCHLWVRSLVCTCVNAENRWLSWIICDHVVVGYSLRQAVRGKTANAWSTVPICTRSNHRSAWVSPTGRNCVQVNPPCSILYIYINKTEQKSKI